MSADTGIATGALSVARDGFCFVEGGRMRGWLEAHGSLAGWDAFADSWNSLGPDPYLAAVGRTRRRRYGVWHADEEGVLTRAPHQPHFQMLAHNPLQGDIERWFEPISEAVGISPAMQAILGFALAFFGPLATGRPAWRIEAHQFRIEATPAAPGEPTPEGVHRDGVDYVLVLLVARRNIASGTTTIHARDGTSLGAFTLAHTFDAALLDDTRVFHGVTPVLSLDPEVPSHRDVLVVTLRRCEQTTGRD